MNTTNPALLQFSINGINLGNIFQASYNSCEWNQFYSIWNSGNNTSVDICIVNQNTNAAGNDFALDDIGFYELCTSVDSVKISVIPTTQSFSQVVCDSLRWHGTLYNTTGAYTYSFVNANGCISTDTLHLTVNTSTYRVENQMACRNFIWHNVNYTSSGTYLYRYNNGFGCPSVDTLHLAINARPNLGQDVTRKICYGSTFDLTSLFSLSGLQSNWTFNGNLVNNPALAYMNGIYQLVVTDISGCNDTAKVNLAINPPVIANAGNDTVVQLNTSFQLHGSGGSTYLWSPSGVLNNSNVASPLATISNSTQFVLIVFDNLGCSDSDSILVRAISGPQIYVPNSFTPNGDGLNDIFKPIYVGIYKINYFSIFNRYGEKIFETSSINIGWDGKFKGSNQPMTNYIWIVSGKDKNNNPVQKKGNVLLIR
jgi:gliding motility-associated-like protein